MFDPQVSYIRLLIGDNSRTAPFYTDTQIRNSAYIGPTRPGFPIDLRIAGVLGFHKFPVPYTGTIPGLSLSALTDAQLAALTDLQLASLVD